MPEQETTSFRPWRRKRGRQGRCQGVLGGSNAGAVVSAACHNQSRLLRPGSGIKLRAAPKSGLPLSRRGWIVVKPNAARSPSSLSYFGDDLSFVAFPSQSGIHALPSKVISRLSTLLIKSGVKTQVPLILACFPPVTCVPE